MLDIEKPELLNVIEGPSALSGSFTKRPSAAIVFKISGESVYRFGGRSLRLSKGEVLYIPQDASYSYGKISSGESRYALINFTAASAPKEPKKYRPDDSWDFDRFCLELCRLSLLDTLPEQYRAMTLFYQALEAICRKNTAAGSDRILMPAVTCLQKNLYNADLRISQLHTLCGVSDTYFRKLFIARFGVGPKQYVQQLRLRRARDILSQGEYSSISQVARQVGFEDPLYFSKQFHRTYGIPPTAVRR